MIGPHSTYFISSQNRINSSESSGNFIINTPGFREKNNYDSICLLSANIPKTWYLIDSPHDYFTISENGISRTVSLEIGNYDADDLVAELDTKLNIGGYTYTATLPSRTNKINISVSGNGGNQPIITVNSRVLQEILGMDSTTLTFSANSVVFPSVIKAQKISSLLLTSDYVSASKNGVLQDLNGSATDFSNIVFNQPNIIFNSKPLQNKNVSQTTFRLLDFLTGEVIKLNGGEYTFSFVMYKRDTLSETQLKRWYINDQKVKI